MNIVDQVFDYLQAEGLKPTRDEDNDIVFKYQKRTYYYSNPGNDHLYFRMVLPGIDDVTEDNREAELEAANKINTRIKLAKLYVSETNVHAMVEIFLDSDPEFEDIIPRVMQILIDAQIGYYQEIQ